MALRHEGAHSGRCRQRPGAHGHHDGGQRGGRRTDRRSAAWQGTARVGRLGLPRCADARGSRGPAMAHRRAAERHRQAARGAPQGGGPTSASTARPACGRRSSIPFRVIKRQFGLVKVRFRGLAKNTAHVVTLFALSNLWMARQTVDGDGGSPSTKRMRHAERGGSRPKRHRVSSVTRARLLDQSNAVAFSRCSDLP